MFICKGIPYSTMRGAWPSYIRYHCSMRLWLWVFRLSQIISVSYLDIMIRLICLTRRIYIILPLFFESKRDTEHPPMVFKLYHFPSFNLTPKWFAKMFLHHSLNRPPVVVVVDRYSVLKSESRSSPLTLDLYRWYATFNRRDLKSYILVRLLQYDNGACGIVVVHYVPYTGARQAVGEFHNKTSIPAWLEFHFFLQLQADFSQYTV